MENLITYDEAKIKAKEIVKNLKTNLKPYVDGRHCDFDFKIKTKDTFKEDYENEEFEAKPQKDMSMIYIVYANYYLACVKYLASTHPKYNLEKLKKELAEY